MRSGSIFSLILCFVKYFKMNYEHRTLLKLCSTQIIFLKFTVGRSIKSTKSCIGFSPANTNSRIKQRCSQGFSISYSWMHHVHICWATQRFTLCSFTLSSFASVSSCCISKSWAYGLHKVFLLILFAITLTYPTKTEHSVPPCKLYPTNPQIGNHVHIEWIEPDHIV